MDGHYEGELKEGRPNGRGGWKGRLFRKCISEYRGRQNSPWGGMMGTSMMGSGRMVQ